MNAGRLLPVLLILAAAVGCQTDASQVLLERELRLQEDKIFALQGHLDEMASMLEACRRENALLRDEQVEDYGDDIESPTPSSPAAQPRAPRPSTTPRRSGEPLPAPQGRPTSPPMPPTVDPGIEVQPGEEVQPGIEALPEVSQDEVGPSLQLVDPAALQRKPFIAASEQAVAGDSTMVTHITLNKRLTGGYNADRKPGDEGLTVVVEPRDAAGRVVKAAAPVSIVLIDPQLDGPEGRVARWDLTADEAAHAFSRTPFAHGIQMKFYWPAQPPQHRDCRVVARYTTADGRKLEAELPVVMDNGDRTAESWTKAEAVAAAPAAPQSPPSAPKPVAQPEVETPAEPLVGSKPQPVKAATRPQWSPYR